MSTTYNANATGDTYTPVINDRKVKAMQTLLKHGRVTKAQLRKSVPSVINADEYRQIVGEEY